MVVLTRAASKRLEQVQLRARHDQVMKSLLSYRRPQFVTPIESAVKIEKGQDAAFRKTLLARYFVGLLCLLLIQFRNKYL
jgi:hypothetical protein